MGVPRDWAIKLSKPTTDPQDSRLRISGYRVTCHTLLRVFPLLFRPLAGRFFLIQRHPYRVIVK
jgi:hypothetical protein